MFDLVRAASRARPRARSTRADAVGPLPPPPLDWCLMKSIVAPLLLVVTAAVQAMGVYPYVQDGITLAGQLLFPILFALGAAYLARKGRPGVFGTAHLLVTILAAVLLVLSLVGMSQRIPSLYPTMILYYIAFVLLAVECGLRIAGLPKKPRPADEDLELDDAESTL